MKSEEALWRMVDVGRFSSITTSLGFHNQLVRINTRKSREGLKDSWEETGERFRGDYEYLASRFEKIDLGLLCPKRFPVETLREMKEDLIPRTREGVEELHDLITGDGGIEKYPIPILDKVNSLEVLFKRMRELPDAFRTNRGFIAYSKKLELDSLEYAYARY